MTVKIIHKNSRVEFKNATADQLEYGELALNFNESGPYLQCKSNDDEIVQLGGVYINASAPLNPISGKWWLNGDTLNVYDGSRWVPISGGGGSGGGGGDPVYDGRLTLQDEGGNTLGTFTANQAGNTTITIPASDFSGSWNDLTDKPTIGDGRITIEESNGNDLGEFTVNQVGNLIITLPAGASFSGSYDDLTNKPTIGDGKLTIKNSDGSTAGEFTANQVGTTDVTLPAEFSGDYGDLTNKPTIGDGKLTVKDSDDNVLGEFTANQDVPTEIVIPAGGGTVSWDDIEGKPCIPECPECIEFRITGAEESLGEQVDVAAASKISFYALQTPELLAALEPYKKEIDDDFYYENVPVHGVDENGQKIISIAEFNISPYYPDPDSVNFEFEDQQFDHYHDTYLNGALEDVPSFQVGADCGSSGGDGTVNWDDIVGKPCLLECGTPTCKVDMWYYGYANPQDFGDVIEEKQAPNRGERLVEWHTYVLQEYSQRALFEELNGEISWGPNLEFSDTFDAAGVVREPDGNEFFWFQTLDQGPKNSTDTIYRTDTDLCGDPGGGGGGGLDDIINAPVVKEVKYAIWEDYLGSYHSMELLNGDGESGSMWKAAKSSTNLDMYGNKGQSSIDGYIEYKTSARLDRPRASNCMAVFDDLVATAYSPDLSEIWSGDSATEEKVEIYVDQGFFHAHPIIKTENQYGNPSNLIYKLELKFTNVHGDPETLWVEVNNYNYIAMRREDIDLSEMEALDAEIKAGENDS